ncbi:acyltransferase [Nibrella saemangeumensis]|uniref:Acyltransferase n=1 Tax=Nibrella saemangeumensis TaxID=1084526 RepID=A0ABP8NHZ8_9BACT
MFRKLFSLDADLTQRVFGLDLLRAIAILIVVEAHSTMAFGSYFEPSFFRFFIPNGVELFFVLSGFLIGGILIRLFEKHQQINGSIILNFWTRRWFRTLPNYYFVLGGIVIISLLRAWRSGLQHTLPPKETLGRYFFFLQNFNQPMPGFFGESWSLAIEEWSYLVLPVLLFLCYRLLPASWPRQRIVLTTILLVILGTNLYRFIIARQVPIAEGEINIYWMVLTRLDAIAYGVLVAYLRHYYPAFWRDRVRQRWLLGLGIICTLLVTFTASPYVLGYYFNWGIYPDYVFYKRTFCFPLTGLSMGMLLPYLDNWRQSRGWFAKGVTHISLISYSMYLLNLTPIMGLVIERIATTSLTVGWLKVGLFWLLVISLSTLLFKYFEKPATELRDRLTPKEPVSTPGGVAADIPASKAA